MKIPTKLFFPSLFLALTFAGTPLLGQDPEETTPRQPSLGITTEDEEQQIEETVASEAPATEPTAAEPTGGERVYSGIRREAVVSIGRSVHIKADEVAETVVVIGASVIIDGRVEEAVVAVGGDLQINGEVGDAVVAVLGSVTAGPNARIDGDLVSVGGAVERAAGAQINGQLQQVDFGGIGLPQAEWLRDYLVHCILKLRPLAPQVGWAWAVMAVIFLLYVLIAVLFPRPVQACVDELTRRPATTLLLGILTKILTPILILLLAATGFGLIVVPFLIAALLLFAVVGKIALLEAIGFQIGRQAGGGWLQNPLPALLVGMLVVLILYIIPVIGVIVFLATGLWGLGCAVSAAFAGIRRELPPPKRLRPSTPLAPAPSNLSNQASATVGAPVVASGFAPSATGAVPETPGMNAEAVATLDDPLAIPGAPPFMPEILAFPRAGFWERVGAGFLDMVLVLLASSLVGGAPLGFLVALAYFAGMWAWRQTTVGGIVLGLKIAREDGQPVSFPVSLVRSLFAGFSILVLFLGFFWIAWDREKQGWHDKITGTVVLKLPRSMPLVCL